MVRFHHPNRIEHGTERPARQPPAVRSHCREVRHVREQDVLFLHHVRGEFGGELIEGLSHRIELRMTAAMTVDELYRATR